MCATTHDTLQLIALAGEPYGLWRANGDALKRVTESDVADFKAKNMTGRLEDLRGALLKDSEPMVVAEWLL